MSSLDFSPELQPISYGLSNSWDSPGRWGPDTLWITAGPGRGKTLLSLFILEDLEQYLSPSMTPSVSHNEERSGKNTDLYYFFCSSEEGSRRSAVAVLRSLIYQIVSRHEDFMKYVLDFLQPMAPGSEQYTETVRKADIDIQANDEAEKEARNK